MHKHLPNLFIFLDQYTNQIFENNNTNVGIIYRNYNAPIREKNLVDLLVTLKGVPVNLAKKVFSLSCERIFYYASMSDKFEGSIHNPPIRGLTLALKENIGVIAMILSDHDHHCFLY